MVRKDYILRLIEEAARALAKVVHLKEQQRFAEALFALHTIGSKLVRTAFVGEGEPPNAAELCMLPDEELLRLVGLGDARFGSTPTTDDTRRARLFAEWLSEEADLYERLYEPERAALSYEAAMVVFATLCQQHTKLDDAKHLAYLTTLLEKRGLWNCPQTLKRRVFAAFDAHRHLAQAETVLFFMLEQAESPQERRTLVQEAERFYQRLASLSDDHLAEGAFSRQEITQGLQDLRAFAAQPDKRSTY
jgi:hypothetical protein